jgi:hypothetical protein
MQDSNFREARRIINLLLKLKRHERKMKILEEDDENKRGRKIPRTALNRAKGREVARASRPRVEK